jgi:broad specificity phosphatase PhoE
MGISLDLIAGQPPDQLLPAADQTPRRQDGGMRYVELRRHTDNDEDRLSEQGVADAETIGRTGLHPPYVLFVSTGAKRATEMLGILRRAAGQEDVPIITETALRSVVEDRWREAAKAAGKGASLEDMRAVDPDLVDHETQLLGAALQGIVAALPDHGRALIVGHSPTNEAAVCGLTGQSIGPLGKGDGVLVVEDAGRYEVLPLSAREAT